MGVKIEMDQPPIEHFDFKIKEYKNQFEAARWAKECLSKFSEEFCSHWCTGCSINHERTVPSLQNWRETQRNLHEALSYLADIVDSDQTCPACSIVEAFLTFSTIAGYSSCRPIAYEHHLNVDFYDIKDIEFIHGSGAYSNTESFPCCSITLENAQFESLHLEREREKSLLWLDPINLPAMPPSIKNTILKKFLIGQNIVRRIYKLSDPNTLQDHSTPDGDYHIYPTTLPEANMADSTSYVKTDIEAQHHNQVTDVSKSVYSEKFQDKIQLEKIDQLPIDHFNIFTIACGDEIEAARWAWVCIEKLAKMFCLNWCVGCESQDNEPSSLDDWRIAQKNLHESFSAMPALNRNFSDCPACAITKGFLTFPTIAKYSPCPPIAEKTDYKPDCFDDIDEFLHAGKLNSMPESFPCCKFYTVLDYTTVPSIERFREQALLLIDPNDLPPMPVPVKTEIKKNFFKAHVVVRFIHKTLNPDLPCYKNYTKSSNWEEIFPDLFKKAPTKKENDSKNEQGDNLQDNQVDDIQKNDQQRSKKLKKGRPVDSDPEQDKRIYEAWKSGRYRYIKDVASEFKIKPKDAQRTIDRHRKRIKRESQ